MPGSTSVQTDLNLMSELNTCSYFPDQQLCTRILDELVLKTYILEFHQRSDSNQDLSCIVIRFSLGRLDPPDLS